MKIIKRVEPKQKAKWSRKIICTGAGNSCTNGCGSLIEVVGDDLRFYDGTSEKDADRLIKDIYTLLEEYK